MTEWLTPNFERLRELVEQRQAGKLDDIDCAVLDSLLERTGPCYGCGQPGTLHCRLTHYENEIQNWVIACDECAADEDAYWQEHWEQHNASRI